MTKPTTQTTPDDCISMPTKDVAIIGLLVEIMNKVSPDQLGEELTNNIMKTLKSLMGEAA